MQRTEFEFERIFDLVVVREGWFQGRGNATVELLGRCLLGPPSTSLEVYVCVCVSECKHENMGLDGCG